MEVGVDKKKGRVGGARMYLQKFRYRWKGMAGVWPLNVGKSLGVDFIATLPAFLNTRTLTEPGTVMCNVIVQRSK